MATRYFNWKLAIVLAVAVTVFAAAVFALHRWQRSTRADQALPLGEKAYAQQNWEEAAAQLGRYLAVNGGDVAVLLKYADAQINKRPVSSSNFLQAIAAYRSVLRLDPGNAQAARRLVQVYLEMRTPGEAELIAGRYLEERNDPVIRRWLAMALMEQRRFAEATKELNTIIRTDPNQVLAYELMGQLAEQRPVDANKPAAFRFDEAVARNPNSALAYTVRADFRLRTNNRTQALADLEQAQTHDLSDVEVRLRLIRALMNANALDKARGHLQALQAQSPAEQMLWRSWAELALRAGSLEEMYTVAETGLKELAAQPWDFMPIATELCIRSGHIEQANDYIARMRKKDIFPAIVAFLEGLLAEKQGQFQNAIADWQKAISLGYRSPGVYLMLASSFSRMGDAQSAMGQLRVLISENPNNLEGHIALARLLAQMRDWSEALAEARRVQQISPGHGEAVLLELQARTHLLAAAGPGSGQEKAWQDVEERLAQLDKANNGALQIKLLQLQVAMIQSKFTEAEAMLRDLESKYPSEANLMLLQAELYAAQSKESEAIAQFRRAMEKFPRAFEPVRGLALFLDRLNERQECESAIKDAMAQMEEPRSRRDLGLLLAELYRRWGQQDKVYPWLAEVARQFPSDIQPKRQLLTCTQVLRDTKQAQGIVDEIKTLEGDKGWQWRYEQAKVWLAANDPNEFKRNYPQVVKVLQENLLANPDEEGSRLLLGAAYERAGDLQLALATYREALARSPDNIQILVRTVATLYRTGENAEAREILDKASQRGLSHPELQKLQLQSDLIYGDLTSASDILQEFRKQDPNDTAASLALASVLMRQNKLDEAKVLLDELKVKAPNSVSVMGTRIQLSIQQGDTAEAIRLCDEAVQNLGNAFAYLLRAETYAALKQNDKAVEDFGRAIAMEPKKADFWASRAEFYRLLGRIDEAIPDIRQALAVSPKSLPLQKRAIALFLISVEPSLIREAEVIVDKALSARPGDQKDYDLLLFKARILALKGTRPATEQARRLLQEITDKHPKSAEAWEWTARLELQQNEPGKAVDVALRGLAHNPENRQLLLLKARAEEERSPMLAVLTLKGLVDQYPKDAEVLIELARAYMKDERPVQAVELLRQRLAGFQGPARRRCEMTLAEALYRNAQRDDARLLFNTLMQAEPQDPAPMMVQAQLLGREKRWAELNQLIGQWRAVHPDDVTTTAIASALAGTDEKEAVQMAEDLLRVTLERNPKSIPNLMLLGMLMQHAGRNKEAIALNRKTLEIDPNNVIAMNNLAWTLCEEPSQCEEALKLAERGLTFAPDYIDLIDTRGTVHYRLGHLEQAVRDFTTCIELYLANAPSVGTSRVNLARAYVDLGRKTEALQQLKQVTELCRTCVEMEATAPEARTRKAQAKKLLEQVLDLQNRTGLLPSEELANVKLLLEQLQKGS